MSKRDTKIDAEVEFSWVNNMHPQNEARFKLGYYCFFRKEQHYFSMSAKYFN